MTGETPQAPPQSQAPAGGTENGSVVTAIRAVWLKLGGPFVITLFLTAWILLYVVLPQSPPVALNHIIRTLLILMAGLLPAIIFHYFQGQRQVLFDEYQQNLRRLGFPAGAHVYTSKFAAVYGQAPVNRYEQSLRRRLDERPTDGGAAAEEEARSLPLQTPVVVATLFSVIGWLIAFYPVIGPGDTLQINPTPLAYGFLGAYVFGIGALVRQYVTGDLQQRYYASMIYRYLFVLALVWALVPLSAVQNRVANAGETIGATAGNLVNGAETEAGESDPAAETATDAETASSGSLAGLNLNLEALLLVAFVAGFFPSFLMRLILRQVTRLLGKTPLIDEGFNERQPLHDLQGLNAYHADRLLLEGIENIQNMASADIVDLMLRTRLPVERIVDWIDQAVLYIHVDKAQMKRYRRANIRNATDFLDAYQAYRPGAGGDGDDANGAARQSDLLQKVLAGPDGEGPSITAEQLHTLAVTLKNDPNIYHLDYWRNHKYDVLPEDIEIWRTAADLLLMDKHPADAIPLYDQLLHRFSNSRSGYLYRGLAHDASGNAEQAVQDYKRALADDQPWANVHHARLHLGRALIRRGAYEEAIEQFQKAIDVAPPSLHFVQPFLQIAVIHLLDNHYGKAVDQLEKAIGVLEEMLPLTLRLSSPRLRPIWAWPATKHGVHPDSPKTGSWRKPLRSWSVRSSSIRA